MPSEDQDREATARTEGFLSCKVSGDTCQKETKTCPVCHEEFCEAHASVVDPEFCFTCLKPEDTTVDKLPLIDDEGVTHEGTVQKPVGPAFNTLAERIVAMTEEQLRAHIQYYKKQVKEAERVLDYRRIALGTAELQLAEVEDANRRKLRGVKVTESGRKVSVSTASGSQDEQSKKLAAMLRGLGITTPEQAKNFLANLANAAKNGAKK